MNNPKELFNSNTKLVYKVYYDRMLGKPLAEEMEDDLIQIGMMSLWRCCHRYDESRGIAFSTYAYNAIRKSMMCALVREGKKAECLVSMSKQVKVDGDSVITYEDTIASSVNVASEVEINAMIEQVTQELGNNSKKIIEMIREGHTQVDVARELKITRAKVGKILKKFRKKIKDTLFLANDEYN